MGCDDAVDVRAINSGYAHEMNHNIVDLQPETPIWRVFGADRFLRDVASKRLSLVRVGMWDDPFENFLSKWEFYLETGERVRTDQILNRFFGQCWSHREAETDATWRIYSPHKNGVRVRSTVGAVFAAMWDSADVFAELKYFAGRVRYVEKAAVLHAMTSSGTATGLLVGSGGRDQINTLLVKRLEFEHEQEARLLFRDTDDQFTNASVVQYPLEPNVVYQDAVFHPQMTDDQYEDERKKLRMAGFTGPISRSDLYRPPTGRVILT
jgi:hypothetical protein